MKKFIYKINKETYNRGDRKIAQEEIENGLESVGQENNKFTMEYDTTKNSYVIEFENPLSEEEMFYLRMKEIIIPI